MSQLMVSIVCISYNYDKYIAAAIEGFLNQKVNFLYEIIIIDDCSTDHSYEIICSYAEKYPDLFRIFRNEKNKGITKTWISICKEARGKYIARCDADDIWIDPYKLQKQVDLLENTSDSKWCNTSFNIIDESNILVAEDVFKNGPIPYANTYEKMLAIKGMTLTSSWLIETKLMQEVNDIIDPESVDDSYPMQLEFFRRTNLSFISEPTVSYRMTNNSDSRPKSEEKMMYRIDGLLKTQLDYLEKYPDQDMHEIAKLLVQHDAQQERRIYQLSKTIHELNDNLKENQELVQSLIKNNEELSFKNSELIHQYNSVIHSRRWIIPTKIINILKRRK